ncbi:MAG: hypothetical protein ACI867_002014 [Glaciecola sp.]|jgi:hypothetical protein
MSTRRLLEQIIVPLAVLLAFVVPTLIWSDRLPGDIAIHWDARGGPDGSTTVGGALWIFLTIWSVLWIGAVVMLRARPMERSEARVLIGIQYGVGGFLLALWTLGLATNLDVSRWQDAGSLGGSSVIVGITCSLPLAALGWWLASDREEQHAVPVSIDAGVDGRSTSEWMQPAPRWQGQAVNKGIGMIAAPLAGVGLWLLIGSGTAAGTVLLVVAVVLVTLAARVTVRAGPEGLQIGLGWFGVPRRTIPLEAIASIALEEVAPLAYGGWGFRLAKGAQAYIVRRGPGIRVERHKGSAVLVTVDDAQAGAAVLASHLRHAKSGED